LKKSVFSITPPRRKRSNWLIRWRCIRPQSNRCSQSSARSLPHISVRMFSVLLSRSEQVRNNRKVHVVTNSTCNIPMHVREELGIEVVPLSINFETETLLDGVDITPQEYVQRLGSATKLPSTAQPTVEQFQKAYKNGLDAGLDVVCITISSG